MTLKSLLFTLAALGGLVARAHVQAEHLPPENDAERPNVVREIYRARFDDAALNFEYSLRAGRVFREKWGDGFVGLQLGRMPRNGGWSRWDFLDVVAAGARGNRHVLQCSAPTIFTAYAVAGSDRLLSVWRDGSAEVRLRVVAHPAYRNWLFCELCWQGLDVARIVLSAYPGNAAARSGRERHFAISGRDWNLSAESASFVPQSGAALLYSRYFDEPFGDKLVFDVPSVSRVEVAKTSTRIDVVLRPKACRIAFALGGFADSDPDTQIVRFLGEDAETVASFLGKLDFAALPDVSEFRQSLSLALELGVDREVLRKLVGRYKASVSAHDVTDLIRCLDEVRALRLARVRSELSKWK